MIVALIFSGLLVLIAVLSIHRQLGNLKKLRTPNLPSDEYRYRRNLAYRRLVTGALLLILAGLIAGAFLSGMVRQADEIGNRVRAEGEDRPPPSPEEKEFLRQFVIVWASILVLIFVIISLAVIDMWATRKYAWAQLKRIRSEQQALLERDLAVHRQQKLNDRMRNATDND